MKFITRLILISFCLMVYCGLRGFEIGADVSMIVLLLGIIAYPKNKEE